MPFKITFPFLLLPLKIDAVFYSEIDFKKAVILIQKSVTCSINSSPNLQISAILAPTFN